MTVVDEATVVNRDPLDLYLDRIKHLPPTPTVMIKLIKLFRRADADADDIVSLLRRDPALSAEVLRRCNNSFFGEEPPVTDINEAVFRLGFYEVYRITVSLFGMRALTPQPALTDFPVEALRRHSSIAAIAAGALARALGESEGIAFTAGLLHDVGKVALAAAEGAKYTALLNECQRTKASLSAAEISAFGFNHSEIGARLLGRWGVPDEVTVPVQGHNHPAWSDARERMVVITNLASQLANHIQQDLTDRFYEGPVMKPAIEFLGLEVWQIVGWEFQVRSHVKQLPALAKP